jgi:hypothetical protein
MEENMKEEVAFVRSGWRKQLNILVLGLGTIFVWRGVWTLNDELIFKSDPVLSACISIVIGLLFFIFMAEIKI